MSHTLAEIRKYLMSAYNDQEIETLYFDHFPKGHENLSGRMTKGDKVLHLVEYCYERDQLAQLLGILLNDRGEQFKRTFGDCSPEQLATEMTAVRPEPSLPPGIRAVLESCVSEHIAVQQGNIRYYGRLVGALVLLGLIVIVFAVLAPERAIPLGLKQVIGLAGAFVMSCAVLPALAMEGPRRELGRFRILRAGLAALGQELDFETRTRMESLVWQAIKKTALGFQLDQTGPVASAVA